jgi:integrase
MGVKVEHVEGDRYRVRILAGTDPETGRPIRRTRYFRAASQRAANKLGAHYENELRKEVTEGRGRREYMDGLIDDWWRHHSARAAATTLHSERSIVARIRQHLGRVRLDELNGQHIDRFYTALRSTTGKGNGHRTERPLSESTIHHHHRVLKAILRTGERWDRIKGDVTRKATPPRKPRPKLGPPTSEQLAALLDAAGDRRTLFLFFAKTGMRRGEVCAVRWSDLRNGVVHVSRSIAFLNGRFVEKDTKTHEERKVVLDDATQLALRDYRMHLEAQSIGGLHPDAFMFPDIRHDHTGMTAMKPDTVTQAWLRLCQQHGVKARLHDLRHWNASLLLAAGVPLKAVSEHLGHSQPSTTLNIYAKTLGDGGIREALQKALPASTG